MKTSHFARRIALLCLGLIVLAGCGTSGFNPLPLTKTFGKSPDGFSFQYPDEWDYNIPVQGILLSGPREALDGTQAGPLFTVLRGLPISISEDLSGALNLYLERGPLAEPDKWRITTAEAETTVDGRPALMVELEGTDSEAAPLTYSRVIAVAADSTFVYMFVINVPVSLRARFEPTLDAMLASVRILE